MLRYSIYGSILLLFIFILYLLFSTEKGLTIKPIPAENRSLDYANLAEEAALDLQKYIQIQTVRGQEREAALFLKAILEKEGITVRLFEYPNKPERVNLIAEIKGTEEKGGLILSNHMDVVEAVRSEWSFEPFEGFRQGDRIFGRGAIDMKGLGIMQLYAFILVKKMNLPLKYNLMFLALADEETRSQHGARFLLSEYPDLFKGYEFMHNEGGSGTKDVILKGSEIFNIQYAEKGIIWLEAYSEGESGHGSTPHLQYAAKDMLNFLTEIQNVETEFTISDVTASFFYQMGTISPFPASFVLKRNRNFFLKPLLDSQIQKNRHLQAMTKNTISITGINTYPKGINVITPQTKAMLDIRILPGVKPEEYYKKLEKIAKKYKIRLKALHMEAATVSAIDSKFFKVLAETVSTVVPKVLVTPFMSPATTDSSYFRNIGIKCYGLIPALLNDKEIDGIHGKDESIRVEHLKTGIQILFESIVNYNK
ncbi:MAG: M20/M25/M40 family metallo-hydrolase [Leptospiraceae bacterium]|nr:M20/M25/M40 family metallo-hydrolase [Leptospiraceae bacterium]MCP5501991.1 M20/M25/M40 family metallo-hydrolase [Leptospiraceae bacterium]